MGLFSKRSDSELEEEKTLLESPTSVLDSPGGKSLEEERSNTKMLALSFISLLIVGLGNKVFNKLETIPMHNYPFFISLYSTFIYLPASFLYIIPMILFGSQITQEQREIPQFKFLVMGALDSIAGVMQVFATNYLDGSLVIMLSQVAIPISMILSFYLMKVRYNLFHIFGATIVIAGLCVVLVPQLAGGGMTMVQLAWVFCMAGSCVPMTLSSIYKEKALGDTDIDPVYLNGYIALYQFLFSIPLAIPSAYAGGNTVMQIPDIIKNGFLCYVGIDSVSTDTCNTSPFYVNFYLMFNLGYNILIIMILKYGSANLLWLAMALMVPLGSLTFSLPFVPGHKPLGWNGYVGLFVIMLGLIFFRFSKIFIGLYNNFVRGISPSEDEPLLEDVLFSRPRTRSLLHLRADQLDIAQYIYAPNIQRRALRRHPVTIRSGYLGRLGIRADSESEDHDDQPWRSPTSPLRNAHYSYYDRIDE